MLQRGQKADKPVTLQLHQIGGDAGFVGFIPLEMSGQQGKNLRHVAPAIYQVPHGRTVLLQTDMDVRRHAFRQEEAAHPCPLEAGISQDGARSFPLRPDMFAPDRHGFQQIMSGRLFHPLL